MLHLLQADDLAVLKTYQLVPTDCAESPPKLTAMSMLSRANDAAAPLATAVLCCGYEDGTLRRFPVLDLKLDSLL